MNNDDVAMFVQGIGALGETAGLMRTSFIQNGFTRAEAVQMTTSLLISIFTPTRNEGKQSEKM